jgi:hypothetical protein
VATRNEQESAVAASPQQGLDFVVVAEKRYIEVCRPILENKAQGSVAPALKKLCAELTNSKAAVDMGLAKGFGQITQREQTFDPFVLG